MTEILDYVIIGGGIAGLYCNYKLKKNLKGILLEREKEFGGRVWEKEWRGSLIKMGAGIMALHNKHLLKLLDKLKIKPKIFDSKVDSLHKPFPMNKAIRDIKDKFKSEGNPDGLTVKEFLIKHFGKKFANDFILHCEYNDYIDSDPEYFIKYYNINDMSHGPYKTLIIDWIKLVNKLVKSNCYAEQEVKKVNKIIIDSNEVFQVKTSDKTYLCKKVIFALTLKPLDKLIKNLIDFSYKDYLGTVPFVRIYSYYKKPYDTNLGHYTLVPNKLQKIIRISPNILMTSYSDHSYAKYWKQFESKSKATKIKIVESKLKDLGLDFGKMDDIEFAYWSEGVHYFKPIVGIKFDKLLNKLSKPSDNIFVIGEIISKKQGWVEGCIESVDRVFH